MNKNYAYVTFCNTANYLEGLMTTWLCLRNTGTKIPFYAMLPTKLIQEKPKEVTNLKNEGINIIEYPKPVTVPQVLIDNNTKSGNLRGNQCYDKLLVFEQTQFDKIVYIDTDIYILQSLDRLFDMPHMAAMIAGKSYPGNESWVDLSAGIFTIVPKEGMVEEFMKVIPTVIENNGALGDMSILQAYYSDWPNHPELDMGEKYGVMSYYAHYFEENLGYHYNNDVNDPKSVAIIHYASEKKPWMQHWSPLSVIKQELQLAALRLIHKRNTDAVLLEYKHLVRKARKLLYAK